jgi:alpha-tubulin suppressor-like RCC1 family protein
VCTATTFEGDGSSMTGVAMTIAPLSYQPDPYDTLVTKSGVGIGITFDHRIIAGSGNITLRLVGAAGTVVENFGVGSSVSISGRKASITPTAALVNDTVYHINYPSGCFTNTSGDVSYVGTAYTFTAAPTEYQLWVWGENDNGALGQNNVVKYSSPVQVAGTTWATSAMGYDGKHHLATKTDGTLWAWGSGGPGQLGHNSRTDYSSPVQVPGTTWNNVTAAEGYHSMATRTDGTLWVMGDNTQGQLGLNDANKRSSPTQIPGTWATGDKKYSAGMYSSAAIKADGTLWSWGYNKRGVLGTSLAHGSYISSPTQIPGTTWRYVSMGSDACLAVKTDNTLWAWGYGAWGNFGNNVGGNPATRSSPVQVPGTTWAVLGGGSSVWNNIIKTDGTLWSWGYNGKGRMGVHTNVYKSSPVQVGSDTTWSTDASAIVTAAQGALIALKTDGTLWSWGYNNKGQLGQNNLTQRSSPVQIPGTNWTKVHSGRAGYMNAALKEA